MSDMIHVKHMFDDGPSWQELDDVFIQALELSEGGGGSEAELEDIKLLNQIREDRSILDTIPREKKIKLLEVWDFTIF